MEEGQEHAVTVDLPEQPPELGSRGLRSLLQILVAAEMDQRVRLADRSETNV